MALILIKNDLFNISKRIKNIDNNYELYFNNFSKKFEVHYRNSFSRTLELVLPFEYLDDRCIEYTNKSRVQNMKTIIQELEQYNNEIELAQQNNLCELSKEVLKECKKF